MFLCIDFIKIPTYHYESIFTHTGSSEWFKVLTNIVQSNRSGQIILCFNCYYRKEGYTCILYMYISIIIQVSLCMIWNRIKLIRFVPTIHYGMFVADTKNINKTNERNLPMIHIGYKKSHYWLHRTSIYRDLKCN